MRGLIVILMLGVFFGQAAPALELPVENEWNAASPTECYRTTADPSKQPVEIDLSDYVFGVLENPCKSNGTYLKCSGMIKNRRVTGGGFTTFNLELNEQEDFKVDGYMFGLLWIKVQSLNSVPEKESIFVHCK